MDQQLGIYDLCMDSMSEMPWGHFLTIISTSRVVETQTGHAKLVIRDGKSEPAEGQS